MSYKFTLEKISLIWERMFHIKTVFFSSLQSVLLRLVDPVIEYSLFNNILTEANKIIMNLIKRLQAKD